MSAEIGGCARETPYVEVARKVHRLYAGTCNPASKPRPMRTGKAQTPEHP